MRHRLLLACGLAFVSFPAFAQTSARVTETLRAVVEASPRGARQTVWVYFTDKNGATDDDADRLLTARAAERRARRGLMDSDAPTFEDRPVSESYVGAVRDRVSRLRHLSRWLNAVSVEANSRELDALQELDFVARLDVVRRYRREGEDIYLPAGRGATRSFDAAGTSPADDPLDYGTSFDQLAQIQVPTLHERGFHGEGIVVAVFDTGFDNLKHPAFAEMTILAQRDFVNGDDDVADGTDMGDGSHGTGTLSVLGAFAPGELIGPAFRASYILAKTENTASETPVEEDHWAAAAEWAEALGADVISSSLGYLTFDPGFPSYDYTDMDGETAVTTRAAQLAAERGVLVVTSAGNAGFRADRNTLGAPADGKLVLSIGAVDSFGTRVGFSSVGPTADGRIKPDVMARGALVKIAGSFSTEYRFADGTSFSCPLVAGVGAVVLQVHPDWRIDQVIQVLHDTASQAGSPDNLMGWGIVDALRAIESVPAAPTDATPN